MTEVEEIFDLFFYRPLAFLLVKIIYPTNITPNQLTVGAIIMGIIGGFFYAQGTPLSPQPFVIGAIFYMLFNILDCSDGQLARLKKNGSQIGRILDGGADYIAGTAIYIGIGIGFANHSDKPVLYWGLLLLCAASNTFHSILVDYYRNRFLDIVLDRKSILVENLEEFRQQYNNLKNQKNKYLERIIIYIYLNYSNFQNKLSNKKSIEKQFYVKPSEYLAKNKIMIRFWILLGPTSQISTLIICSIFNRFDVFFWIIIVGYNSLAIVSWLFQRSIDFRMRINV